MLVHGYWVGSMDYGYGYGQGIPNKTQPQPIFPTNSPRSSLCLWYPPTQPPSCKRRTASPLVKVDLDAWTWTTPFVSEVPPSICSAFLALHSSSGFCFSSCLPLKFLFCFFTFLLGVGLIIVGVDPIAISVELSCVVLCWFWLGGVLCCCTTHSLCSSHVHQGGTQDWSLTMVSWPNKLFGALCLVICVGGRVSLLVYAMLLPYSFTCIALLWVVTITFLFTAET